MLPNLAPLMCVLFDMEGFTDSKDELSRLIRETIGIASDDELALEDLETVAAARKIPPLSLQNNKS